MNAVRAGEELSEKAAVVTFETFQPGAAMGSIRERVDDEILGLCRDIYGPDSSSDARRPELATICSMRAYLKVVSPRPPGNIHARERISIDDLPKPGEEIETSIICVSKEMKGERRRVVLSARTTGEGGRALFSAEMTMFWAR
jgi:hypothetical protein